jgi:hypothetical protein
MVSEGSQFSIWDLSRTAQPVVRCLLGYGNLNAVASSDANVATAGDDRAVNIISPKKWRLVGAWKGALKYGVGSIMFSSVDRNAMFAASHDDSEIACGRWTKGTTDGGHGAPVNGQYRGDARWTGVCRVNGTDDCFGLTAAGSILGFHNLFARSVAFGGGGLARGDHITDHQRAKRLKQTK